MTAQGPSRLGPYQLERELAGNSQRVVYQARDSRDGSQVAIKLLVPGPLNQHLHRRLAQEAAILTQLRHPRIVRVREVNTHWDSRGGTPYLVLDWIEGVTLAERLRRSGTLPVQVAVKAARDLARALAHAHRKGVLHRDLNPKHLLQDRRGRVHLSMFGATEGSPGYAAPEQSDTALSEVGPAADVYGLGASLFTLLSGSPPAPAEQGLTRIRPDVDRRLDEVVRRCLEPDPGDRFRSADDLAQELERCLIRVQSTVSGELPWGAPGRPARTLPLILSLLLFVGSFGLARWWSQPPTVTASATTSTTGSPAPVSSQPPSPPPPHLPTSDPRADERLLRAQWSIRLIEEAAALGITGYGTSDDRRSTRAREVVSELLSEDPGDPYALMCRALWSAEDQKQQARRALSRLHPALLEQSDLGVLVRLLTLIQAGQRDEVPRLLHQTLERDVPVRLCDLGTLPFFYANSAASSAEEALQYYRQARDAAPLESFYQRELARHLLRMGRLEEAAPVLQRAWLLCPTDLVTLWLRCDLQRALGNETGVLEELGRLLAVHPDHEDAHLRRIDVHARLAQWEPMLRGCDAALERFGEQPRLLGRRAVSLRWLDRIDEALSAAGRATELDPHDGDMLLLQARLLFLEERFGEARLVFDQARQAKVAPTSPDLDRLEQDLAAVER